MGLKTSHSITVEKLLTMIPESLLENLSNATGVNYQVKKLFGKNMFYLLLYGFLESTKVSLRSLEDIYNSQKFKFLFNIDQQNNTKYNSLSDRLASMDSDYLKKVYEHVYALFTDRYTTNQAEQHSIVRVDSTMVAEASNKLKEGMRVSNQHKGKKQVKYTVLMTDIFPSGVEVFTDQKSHNENNTIPLAILNHTNKSGVFVFDRGVNKRDVFSELSDKEIKFVSRIDPKARFEKVSNTKLEVNTYNNLILVSDEIVRLYNKRNKLSIPFRFIRTKRNDKAQEEICFISNCFDLEVTEIISIYRKRWDIEVFFRFIKQELNFSHFVSTKSNGIKNILYLTLILSILILIYKKVNNIGYKTAVRRFRIELDELITKMMISFAGGDPNLVFR